MKIVPAGERKCIWMESGVISFKLCNNNYNCETCRFDQAMQDSINEKKKFINWSKKLKDVPAYMRKCRYMISGDISYKICPNGYNCKSCEFDQMMQDKLTSEEI